jgi:Predicted nucleotide-binding protein containing TIR-like domain
MKPRVFIGSSSESLAFAEAIHRALTREAECTLWNASFSLGGTTLGSLMATMRTMDFAVFVFAPDDAVEMRGERYLIARDNVLYELGLFTGHLQPERCFFVLPDTIRVHVPSDLNGVTHGVYEAGRSDRNTAAAVGPFCSEVKERIKALSFSKKSLPIILHELAVKFECADWINPLDAKVREKRSIVSQMIVVLSQNPMDKRALLNRHRVGFTVLLGAAVQQNPTIGDDEFILSVRPDTATRGVAQATMVKAVDDLESNHSIAPSRRKDLARWLGELREVDPTLLDRIADLRARLS